MNFRRINFFKGLFMTAEDWKAEQQYHIEKRRLHSRTFLTPGVVFGEDDELSESLKVTVTEGGRIIVQPGYALDGKGRDLFLAQPEELDIPTGASGVQAEKEIYVYIAFKEEPIEPRENRLNPDLKDNAFILERPTVGWTEQAPDNVERIELARFQWRPGRRISMEHISARHVRRARPRQAASTAERILSDETTAPAAASGELTIQIESFAEPTLATGLMYLANVIPIEPMPTGSSLRWRIESSTGPAGGINYHLFLQGVHTVNPVKVRLEVYRLRTTV